MKYTNFIKIQPHVEVEVPDYFSEEREVDVIVCLRASDDGVIYWGPLECSGSIHKNKSMMELQQQFIKNYIDDGYKHVEVREVFIDEQFLSEYKSYAKKANKEESQRLMAVVGKLLV